MVPDFVWGFNVVKNIITPPSIETEEEPEQLVQHSVTPSIIREFTKPQTLQKTSSPMPYFDAGSQDSIPNVSDIMGNETLEAALAGGGTQYTLGDTSTLMGFIMSTQCAPPQGPANCMAPVMEPMPKDDSAMETPVTVTEGKAESASATDTTVTVTEAEAKSEHPELLQTDGPSNGIDTSQPLFSQPEPKPIMERITAEERRLRRLNAEEVMPAMAEEPVEITPGLQAKQRAECAEAKAAKDEAAKR